MSDLLARDVLAAHAIIHDRLPIQEGKPHAVDRTFELPKVLYGVTAGLYVAFLAIMAAGMSTPGLIIPLTICAIFFAMFFAIPVIFTKVKPDASSSPATMAAFRSRGITTHTGPLSARDATIQMLILPVLIVLWGLVCVSIAAIVA